MRPYVHLSADERLRIYQWQREGLPQAEIARRLGRDRATISRELRRNAIPAGYLPDLAQRRYQARRQHCRRRPRLENRPCAGPSFCFWSGACRRSRSPADCGLSRVRPWSTTKPSTASSTSCPSAARRSSTSTCAGARRSARGVRVAGASQPHCPTPVHRRPAAGRHSAHRDRPLGERFPALRR